MTKTKACKNRWAMEQRDENSKKEPKRSTGNWNTVAAMMNTFDGLPARPDMAEESLSELEDLLTESTNTIKQNKQWQKQSGISENCGTSRKGVANVTGIPREGGVKGTEVVFKTVTTGNFPTLRSDTENHRPRKLRILSRINGKHNKQAYHFQTTENQR